MGNNSEQLNFVINNKTFWSVTAISIIITAIFFLIIYFAFTNVDFDVLDIIHVFSTLILVMSLFFYSKIFIQTNDKHDEILQSQKIIHAETTETQRELHLELLKSQNDNHKKLMEFEKNRFQYEQNVRKENNDARRLQYSFEITENWHKPEMAKLVNRSKMFLMEWEKHIRGGGTNNPKEFNDRLNENPKNRTALISVLNYFEHICILIDEDFADEKAVKKAFSHLFKMYLLKTENYIKHRQETENSKSIYIYFLKYALKWAED